MEKKLKVLTISDHPFSVSGVGHSARIMIEALLKSGKFQFVSLAGAIKHTDYRPQKTEEWGEDLVIYPVNNFGTPDIVRSMLRTEKPDIMWIQSDPRFYHWLFQIENEIRPHIPIVYYNIWDAPPPPMYNRPLYESVDLLVNISKVTMEVTQGVVPDMPKIYHPHCVDQDLFKRYSDEEVKRFKKEHFGGNDPLEGKFVFFFNSRNARRKQSGSTIFWFKEFLDKVGHDKAVLLMHTDVADEQGQNLYAIIEYLGLTNGEVLFSQGKLPPHQMPMLYNLVDCTVLLSDAEGFGLSISESLNCERPVICTMTGGMQEQVFDGEKYFGIGIKPAAESYIGSQDISYILESRVSGKDVVDAMEKMYNMSEKDRLQLGKECREHTLKNFNYKAHCEKWVQIMLDVHEKHGSWDTRKGYDRWSLQEI